MPRIIIPVEGHCPHEDKHAIWQSRDGKVTAVCQMRDSHLLNAMRLLQRVVQDPASELMQGDVELLDYWIDVFDRECSRRFRNRIERARK